LNQTVKALTHSALAVTLMMGNITPPVEQTYYEDDESFHQVPEELETGWSWGFNKAIACGSPSDDPNCYTVNGKRYYISPWSDSSDADDSDTDDHSDNGGGDGPSEPPSLSPEEQKKELIRQCKADALKVNKDEHSNIEAVMQGTIVGCSLLKAKTAVSACTGAAIWAATDAKGKSDIRYADAVAECDKL